MRLASLGAGRQEISRSFDGDHAEKEWAAAKYFGGGEYDAADQN